jgi:hypothetical protein
MRIWDVSPGYLNRQSLLGEHRELHGIVSILADGKKGYANHPETLRWTGRGWALRMRHRLLSVEMALRGYTDRTPVRLRSGPGIWPGHYIDPPRRQFEILAGKYRGRAPGRIPLPETAQDLWRQHKYSVLARDERRYRELGPAVSKMRPQDDFSDLARELTELLRCAPTRGGMRNALQHMWGHVSSPAPGPGGTVSGWSLGRLLKAIQQRAMAVEEPYLIPSTALGELGAWI